MDGAPRSRLAVLALVCVLAVSRAAGQTSNDLADASLEELLNIKVYAASRYYQSTSEAPSAVTVITAQEIREHGYRTLADILRNVPGFYVTYDRNYSFLGVRGFGRPGDWSSRILLLLDNHRMNNNVTGEALLGTDFPLDVDLIERVEIVRGPSSSLYGSNAFFAVINVITRKSAQARGLELSFAPGSFDSYKGRASYGGRVSGADFLFSGSFYDSQGQTLFYPDFNMPATNNGITRNTDDDTARDFLATVNFREFTLQALYGAREKGNPTAYFGTVFNDPRTRNYDQHQYVDLSYQHSLAGKWDVTARTSFDQYRLESPLAVYTGLSDGSAAVDKFSARGDWWTGEVQLNHTFFNKHKLTFGTRLRDNLRQDQGSYVAATSTFNLEQQTSLNWGAYVQDEFNINRHLLLNAGVRYDRYSSFGRTTNPRLGLIYRLRDRTNLKLLYGTAFRAPDVFEMYPNYGNFYADNRGISPERIHSIEGLVEQGLGPRLKLSGSVYRNDIENLISLMPDPGTSGFAYRNYGQALARGMEIALEGVAPHKLQTRVSFSYVDADDNTRDDLQLVNSPRHMAGFNMAAPFLRDRLSAALDGQYTGRRATLAGNSVGGFPVFNFTLLGHLLGKHLDVSASFYNLLDRKYFDPGRPEDIQDVIQQDGRSFRVKLTWKLGNNSHGN